MSVATSTNEERKQRAVLASIAASLALTVAKLGAGAASGSLALLTEGAHNALDVAISALTYFAIRAADKPADEDHPFGHAKIEAVAALAQTGFLLALAIGVAIDAMRRLGEKVEINPGVWAFAAILASLAVDLVRWRTLRRIARETGSDALAADALHFSSDLVSSLLVLVGLIAVRAGVSGADSLAAIGVAMFIGIAGVRLGRRTLDALVDAAPKGLAEKVRDALEVFPAIAAVDFLRMRRNGARTVGELGLLVSRTLPLERVAVIKEDVRHALHARWPRMELTISANPLALDDETVLERVLVTASRRRLLVHHVSIQHVGERISVSLDLEVDGHLTLSAAHEIATRFEEAVSRELGSDIEIDTHIEPMETRELSGEDADERVTAALLAALERHAVGSPHLRDVHDVRLRTSEGALFGVFHCRFDASTRVDVAHAEVDALERAARHDFPEIARLTGHAEPG